MCLLLIANKIHPEYKLIISANRDEFYNRPALQAQFWKDYPELLAGKDLEGGGTWMGITKSGRFSAITNYRDFHNPAKTDAPTRGLLTTGYLTGMKSAEKYSEKLRKKSFEYNGFNLVFGTIDDLFYYSNISNHLVKLSSGLYGLSNALLNTPWPKVTKSKEKMAELFSSHTLTAENIFKFLSDTETAEDEQLPETGLDIERERALSSNFIKTEHYGTRCSTVILVDNNNKVNFIERTFTPEDQIPGDVKFEFNIE
ncbi:MAG TPA: NRDE family protein [Ignavibacteriaceae bacterium]|nr:NRDE family protein [Ignavibacteriaceae bacterium]